MSRFEWSCKSCVYYGVFLVKPQRPNDVECPLCGHVGFSIVDIDAQPKASIVGRGVQFAKVGLTTVAGGTVGFFVGGPVGAVFGAGLGAAIGRSK